MVSIKALFHFWVSSSSGNSSHVVIAELRYHRHIRGPGNVKPESKSYQHGKLSANMHKLHSVRLAQMISFRYEDHFIESRPFISTAAPQHLDIWYVTNVLGSGSGGSRLPVPGSVGWSQWKCLRELEGGEQTSQTWADAFSRPFQICSSHFLLGRLSPRASAAADGWAGQRLHTAVAFLWLAPGTAQMSQRVTVCAWRITSEHQHFSSRKTVRKPHSGSMVRSYSSQLSYIFSVVSVLPGYFTVKPLSQTVWCVHSRPVESVVPFCFRPLL